MVLLALSVPQGTRCLWVIIMASIPHCNCAHALQKLFRIHSEGIPWHQCSFWPLGLEPLSGPWLSQPWPFILAAPLSPSPLPQTLAPVPWPCLRDAVGGGTAPHSCVHPGEGMGSKCPPMEQRQAAHCGLGLCCLCPRSYTMSLLLTWQAEDMQHSQHTAPGAKFFPGAGSTAHPLPAW